MRAALLAEPNWTQAARALISGCVDLRHDDDLAALLEAVCRGLGDELYPAFLRVLAEVGRQGQHDARAAVARALVHALRTGRLPSGRRGAWGASAGGGARSRSMGPLEYLCAWAVQSSGADGDTLPAADFESAAQAVMTVVSASNSARLLYCEKLLADAADPLEGALSRNTRQAMAAMAQAWAGGAMPAEAAARFVMALPRQAGTLASMALARSAPVPR
jgi:hypothetical protein